MLRIALPNKGSLSTPAAEMLREAGYRGRSHIKELSLRDGDNDVEFFFLRPRDIATYVGSGQLDVGITGHDLLLDSGVGVQEILQLGFARSVFHFAARPGTVTTLDDLSGRTIATSYTGVVSKYLADHGITAYPVHLDGAVETSIELGVAAVIADVVETGTTLANAGLEVVGEPIMTSQAVLVCASTTSPEHPQIQQLIRRLRGVLLARQYVMLDYNVRVEDMEDAVAVTPGMEGPTISPLHVEGWVAVRAMVRKNQAHTIMDTLEEIGARAILITGIHACRM